MTKEWDVVEVLRHYRHDWLNKLQLIKGNLDIGRLEKVDSLIDDVIRQTKNESHLSNMNVKHLATRLLTFNWEEHPFVLHFEVINGKENWQPAETKVMSILEALFTFFNEHAKQGYDNQLYLTLKDLNGIEIEIDYHGQLSKITAFQEDLRKFKESFSSVIAELESEENSIYIHIKMT
ncbi:sporulation initiation phosphotransferase B [Evansella cellulosilytica]|uniref:Sporulation initiation phosphotransferase B C-terminal domain-containing protein n=1 Tax=Evansella cellulosilytica (strain ATCC 21833 / DSM 2522 / FERM P-1141 / JCM 9156 / N-4) TaxID=649639 RepID=E6TV62_EVAC2|nr:sporulation initiation phosphotransferase B [Evansella cellulosilytica]ADU29746.1 hypothetical protein Bcell_1483 [Evansella cellulosilytica DSM 2522]